MKVDISIVLIHYNQNKYILNCLKSILSQENVKYELIIIDDCSQKFEESQIKEEIHKKRNKFFQKYIIIKNKENIGTVKTLNIATKNCSGNYIIYIAADDELNNNHCLADINNVLVNKYKNKQDVLITQQLMCDIKIKEFYYYFMDNKYENKLNNFSSNKIFNILSRGCVFPSGSTIYKRDFIQNNKFDERFLLIEDWPMFLNLCLKGKNIKYENIITINHRDCGISHSEETTSKHTDFIYDIYKIHEEILMPNLNKLTFFNKLWVIKSYKFYRKNYAKGNDKRKLSLNYYLYNFLIILWYNFIKLKNIVDTQQFINYSFILFMLVSILKKPILNRLFSIYIIISANLIIINILYNFYEKIKKFFHKNELKRR